METFRTSAGLHTAAPESVEAAHEGGSKAVHALQQALPSQGSHDTHNSCQAVPQGSIELLNTKMTCTVLPARAV